jgi:hypothetical protein
MAFVITRPFVLLAATTLGAVGAFRYNAARLRDNDLRQRRSSPYVTVDRSGGGV